MEILWIFLGIALLLLLLATVTAFVCYRLAFYADRKKDVPRGEYPMPRGEVYEPYLETMLAIMKRTETMDHEDVSVTSFDGLTLRGKYYEYAPGAPIELMFPGYRGNARLDLCGAVERCFAVGHSALIVDQRCCGESDGKVITFGVRESRDCRTWIDFMLHKFGPEVKIILAGMSMGATTVLIAAGGELPDNVIGVLADCGFTSAREIIPKVIRDLKLPAGLLYPFVRLGARLFGGFSLEAVSPLSVLGNCKIPVILFHGEDDNFVPCDMSRKNYEVCTAPKRLVTIPGAGHGLCYMVDPERYLKELKEFWEIPR